MEGSYRCVIGIRLERLRKSTIHFIRDSRCPDRGSNWISPEDMLEALFV
jgi:hypothetical protein